MIIMLITDERINHVDGIAAHKRQQQSRNRQLDVKSIRTMRSKLYYTRLDLAKGKKAIQKFICIKALKRE